MICFCVIALASFLKGSHRFALLAPKSPFSEQATAPTVYK